MTYTWVMNLPADLELHKGTPPFIKTFTDKGNFSASSKIVESDSTYVEGDLQASMTILANRIERVNRI